MASVQEVLIGLDKKMISFLCGWHQRLGKYSFMVTNMIPFMIGEIIGRIVQNSRMVTYTLSKPSQWYCSVEGARDTVIEKLNTPENINGNKAHVVIKNMLYSIGYQQNCITKTWKQLLCEYNPLTNVWNNVYTPIVDQTGSFIRMCILDKKKYIGIFGGQQTQNTIMSNGCCELIDCNTWSHIVIIPCAVKDATVFDAKQFGDTIAIVYLDRFVGIHAISLLSTFPSGSTQLTKYNTFEFKPTIPNAEFVGFCWVGNNLYTIYRDNIRWGFDDHFSNFLMSCLDSTNPVCPYDVVCFDISTWTLIEPSKQVVKKYLKEMLDECESQL
jgi:hypothetical protein